jgi:hypothetical protein
MTRAGRHYAVIAVALWCLVAGACKQERQPCLTPKIVQLRVKSMHYVPNVALPADSAPPVSIFYPLTAATTTGKLYAAQSAYALSLSPVADTVQWEYVTDTSYKTPSDTLTFHYQRNRQFLSNACGYAYYYHIDSIKITNHNIDSVRITDANVTNNVNTSHLRIYLHPG